MKRYFFLILSINVFSQNIDIKNSFFYNEYNREKLDSVFSFTILPINPYNTEDLLFDLGFKKLNFKKNHGEIKFFPIENYIEYNSNFPYLRNNEIMLPNVGIQNVFSTGIYFKSKFFSIKLKPEFHYMENKFFEEFPSSHFPIVWETRYLLWNKIDMPIKFGSKSLSNLSLGQSNILLNYKKLSLGFSSENLWWGPSRFNSIMLSNNSRGFNHFTFNTNRPIKALFGKIEFKYIIGNLNNSGYYPPNIEGKSSATNYYVPKDRNNNYQNKSKLNSFIISYSPKKISNLTLGMIRWLQTYRFSDLGLKYFEHFLSFNFVNNHNKKINKGSGFFLKFKENSFEFYAEYYKSSPSTKNSIHQYLNTNLKKTAYTIGILKRFNDNLYLNWEWTRMEQNSNNISNKIGSWYEHDYIVNGYTNYGEVLGSKIGPGSNSHNILLKKILKNKVFGLGIEIIENDNDFYYQAFSPSSDFRRYWKDFNLKLIHINKFNRFKLYGEFIFIRSLNHKWELDHWADPWYRPGFDKNNVHLNLNISYHL